MIKKIRNCFELEKYLYSQHARQEMENEEFGEIIDEEIVETIFAGKVIEDYLDDQPYPSCLISGKTKKGRPIHIVCCHNAEEDMAIVITVYQPDPSLWVEWERRVK